MLYYKHITEIVKQEFTYRHRSNFFRGVHKMTDSFKLVLFDSIIFLYTTVYVFFSAYIQRKLICGRFF